MTPRQQAGLLQKTAFNPQRPDAIQTCRSRLAGDNTLNNAIASKPDSYKKPRSTHNDPVQFRPVGAGLLAMTFSITPSPASRAPTKGKSRAWSNGSNI
jgi:hypothetical protein